jgi:hypothetical protein
VTECDGQCVVASLFYGEEDDSSDEEMANNKFVGDKSIGASEFHSRLLTDTVPFRFMCDYIF